MKSVLENHEMLTATIQDVAEVAGYLWQKGWAERNGGNITVNITDLVDDEIRNLPALVPAKSIGKVLPALKGCYFYAKGTGKRMRDLARHPMQNGAIIRICPDCATYEIIADEPVMPTSELPSHLSVHNYLIESGSTYKATVHTHPIELVAMSHIPRFLNSQVMTRTLWSMIPETLAFAPLGIGVAPYAMAGSLTLADATLELVKNYDVIMWEKHGVFAVGKDVLDAFDQIDVLNKSACIYMSSKNMGEEPEGMTDEDMKDMQLVYKLPTKRPC